MRNAETAAGGVRKHTPPPTICIKAELTSLFDAYKLGFLSDFVVCVSGKRGVERAASKGSEASPFGVYESLPPRSVKTVTKRGF